MRVENKNKRTLLDRSMEKVAFVANIGFFSMVPAMAVTFIAYQASRTFESVIVSGMATEVTLAGIIVIANLLTTEPFWVSGPNG